MNRNLEVLGVVQEQKILLKIIKNQKGKMFNDKNIAYDEALQNKRPQKTDAEDG